MYSGFFVLAYKKKATDARRSAIPQKIGYPHDIKYAVSDYAGGFEKRSGSVVPADGAFISCITYGLRESIFPGVIEATMDAVERYNKEHFKY